MIHIYSIAMIVLIIVLMAFGLHQIAIALFVTNFVIFIALMITNYYIKWRNRK